MQLRSRSTLRFRYNDRADVVGLFLALTVVLVKDKGPENLQCKRIRLHVSPAVSSDEDGGTNADLSNRSDMDGPGTTLIFVIDANRCGSVCHNNPMKGPGGHTPAPSRRWGEAAAIGARGGKDMPVSASDDVEDVNLPAPRTSLQVTQ
jgi:hypothetical protein